MIVSMWWEADDLGAFARPGRARLRIVGDVPRDVARTTFLGLLAARGLKLALPSSRVVVDEEMDDRGNVELVVRADVAEQS